MSSPGQIQNFKAQARAAMLSGKRIAFFDTKHVKFMDDMKIHELTSDGFVVKIRGRLKTISFENLQLLEVLK